MQRRIALSTLTAAIAGAVAGAPRPARASHTRGVGGAGDGAPALVTAGDGTRLCVRDWGTGRPIVFVAPWALNSEWWDYHLTTLAGPDWRCVAPDRRGHGRSDEPGRGYDFDTLADDLAAILNELDLRDIVLVGHSMGAAEVVRYLTRHRARRVARAVLVAPTTPFLLRTDDNPDGASRETLEGGRDALRRNFHGQIGQAARAFFGAPAIPVAQEALDWWTRMIVDRCSIRVMLALHRAMTETDFRAELPSISVPTLIVHGDRDTSANLELTGRRTHRLIRGSELIVYSGAAHGLAYTHADRLLTDIRSFAG